MLVTYIENFNLNNNIKNNKIKSKLTNYLTKTSNLHYVRNQNTLLNMLTNKQRISYDFCVKFFRFFNFLKENSQNNEYFCAISTNSYLNT